MTPVIETDQLTKIYRSGKKITRALDNLSLKVQQGEIFGYLGPNGAGKTTTIRLLLDLIRPSSGNAQIFSLDTRKHNLTIHKRIGYLPGELSLPRNRTALQIIRHIAEVRGAKDLSYAYELAEQLKFDMSKKMRDYSSGNKRKLGLIIAMMHQPELLILDEPTGGLDPLIQQTFNEIVMRVREEGRTVFLSSHILSEVQAICDRVAILRDGKLKAVESVERLTRVDFRWVTLQLRDAFPATLHERLEKIEGVSYIKSKDRELTLRLVGDFDPFLRAIDEAYIEDMRILQPSLEEIFLNFYGNNDHETETG